MAKSAGKKPPNLQSMIRSKALHANAPTDGDLMALAIAMLYDLPDDVEHHAQRAKVKVDLLRLLHQINQDSRESAPSKEDGLDAQLLQLLAARAARRQGNG